jgi:hypothetical protein
MKSAFVLFVLLVSVCVCDAQNAPARTDVYMIHFAYAAPGKAAQVAEFLKTPDPKSAMPGHLLVLRHQDGAEWDYVAIEHLGAKATVEASGMTMMPAAARDAYAMHTDSYVSGPPWAEFSKAMGIDESAKTGGSVYRVSIYRAAPGHRDELEKTLTTMPSGTQASPANVVLQHLEGGPWNYVAIMRFNSWDDFASFEKNSVGQTATGKSVWYEMREYCSMHNDTLTDRVAP